MSEVKQLKDLIQLPVRMEKYGKNISPSGSVYEILSSDGKLIYRTPYNSGLATALCNELNKGVEVDVEKAAEEYVRDFDKHIKKP